MDSYTVQYSATVIDCSDILPSNATIHLDSTTTLFVITGLEENNIVMGNVTAVNIGGTASANFTTNTITASMYSPFIRVYLQ